MRIALLDTSVFLRRILGERDAFPFSERFDKVYASELLRVEALRCLDRLRILNRWPQEEIALRARLLVAASAFLNFVSLELPVLRRAAEPFPAVVGTLDAIHIATALLLQGQLKKPLVFLTHDKKQGLVAQAPGLEAVGF